MIFKMVFLIVFLSNTPYFTLFLIIVGFISHSVFPINLYKNKETTSQPLSGKYIFSLSHILWESIPIYWRKTFPQNKGILSQALGNLFPQYVELRHCVWKQAKGIHSSIYSMSASGTLHYEKWSKIRVILRRNYEKCLFLNHFS